MTDKRVKELENKEWKCPLCDQKKEEDILLMPQPPDLSPPTQNKDKVRLKVKALVKSKLRERALTEQLSHVRGLVQQGKLLEVSAAEKNDLTWKSFAFGLKKGTLKFVLNSTLDTLPTKTNLLKWKKSISDKCYLRKSQETLKHVLSYCPVSLRQGRLTWRHDGIVRFIATSINQTKYKV